MLAQDGGTPRLSDTTVVVVDVDRNLAAPVLRSNEYATQILETQAVGTPVSIRVIATDVDTTVSAAAAFSTQWLMVTTLSETLDGSCGCRK